MTKRDLVIQYKRENPDASISDVSQVLGIKYGTVNWAFQCAREKGDIEEERKLMSKKREIESIALRNPEMTPKDIQRETGFVDSTIYNVLQELKDEQSNMPRLKDVELTINVPGEQLSAITPWWKKWQNI